ncbi:MAG: hypothetical protein FWG32_07370 [Oscillospiraceae bacterium]|nr:hypothetical protein [Oscillospiraceae bacterium]
MKNKETAVERTKNILITLLVLCAIVLAGQTRLIPGFVPSDMAGNLFIALSGAGKVMPPGASPDESQTFPPAAYPLFSAVTSKNSGRCGVKYDGRILSEIYGRFSGSLAEALGSAGEPEQVSETEWKNALAETGIFFDYLYEQRLSVLAGWLGADMSSGAGEHFARRICLAEHADGVSLYYIRSGDGEVNRCATALALSSFRTRTEESLSVSGGAYFAFELGELFSLTDPYTLIPDFIPDVYELSSGNPLTSHVSDEKLLSLFELNSFIASPYVEAGGAVVYVEPGAVLRVYPNGRAVFRRNTVSAASEALSASEAVEAARAFIAAGIGAYCGAAEPILSGLSYSVENKTYTLTFEYVVNGIPVSVAGAEAAAEIIITNGTLTSATVFFREYRPGEKADILPYKQVAAIVREFGGGEPLLIYEDYGESVAVNRVIN